MTSATTAPFPCILSDERDDFPYDVLSQLAAQGLIGIEVGTEHGGQGADHLAAGIAVEEVARADFNAAYLVFSSTVEGSLLENHSPLAGDLLPRLVNGELKLCLGLTEPESGSDA